MGTDYASHGRGVLAEQTSEYRIVDTGDLVGAGRHNRITTAAPGWVIVD